MPSTAAVTTIRYKSTRNGGPPVSLREALLRGLAPDGGLYVPTDIPPLESGYRTLESLQEVATAMLRPWLEEHVEPSELGPLIADALSFPIPLVDLGARNPTYSGVYVLELFHGPTLSFKDVGARVMARLMGRFLREEGRSATVLVATSGDTGSAVADGFAGQEGIEVVLLYPKGGVSEVQERQLVVERPAVRTYAVEGTFDDCQRLVKQAFLDPELQRIGPTSANSINIGRLLPQAAYYVWAEVASGLREVVFCTPSGNLGNLTGGLIAHLAGLPVARFVAAHNANDYFPDVLRRPDAAERDSVSTRSNAMDVGRPSNYERIRALIPGKRMRELFWGTSVDDPATLARMRTVYDETGYVADPHTAVGLEAVHRYREATGDEGPVIVLSTAHPAKFPATVWETLGQPAPRSDRLERLRDRPKRVEPLTPSLDALKARLLQA